MAKVLIVGAGPAGAATAFLLARNGIEVQLVERETDFQRVFRGEGLMPSGLAALHQMGLREKLNALPWSHLESWDVYVNRRLLWRVREPSADLGDVAVRVVSQPRLLELLVGEAAAYANFQLKKGLEVRDLLREGGRVCGVRARSPSGEVEMRADLVIGADGRASVVRKRAALELERLSQVYDVAWFKVPGPRELEGRRPMLLCAAGTDATAAYVSWDGRLQVASMFPKGNWKEARKGDWLEACFRTFPPWLADHLRAHRDEIEGPLPLDIIVGRCRQWWAPGVLLMGDAAHPMAPVRAQGINVALRDAIVAANHLVPVLSSGAEIEPALARIQQEREPEIHRCQQLQHEDARGQEFQFAHPRLMKVLLTTLAPLLRLLGKTGLPQKAWLRAQRQLRFGVTEVRLHV